METNTFEIILTLVVLSLWVVFPIGMFLSVSHVDKNTDQVIRLNSLRFHTTKYPNKVFKRDLKKERANRHWSFVRRRIRP